MAKADTLSAQELQEPITSQETQSGESYTQCGISAWALGGK